MAAIGAGDRTEGEDSPATGPRSRPGFAAAVMDDGSVCVTLGGDLDVTIVAALAEQLAGLADLRPARLVMDMSGVGYLDCAAARLLADTAAFLPPGQQPVLRSVRPAVERLLHLTGRAGIIETAS
jgi:anti-anti-sigma factor